MKIIFCIENNNIRVVKTYKFLRISFRLNTVTSFGPRKVNICILSPNIIVI